MRRFFLSIVAFALLVFILDRVAGTVLRDLFEDPRASNVDDLTPGFRYGPEVAIGGSSRADGHYVADTLEARLGVKVFNFGRNGTQASIYQYLIAGMLHQHRPPRLWIMEADRRLVAGEDDLDRLSLFLPYAHRYPHVQRLLISRSTEERIRMLSRVYPYNSLLLSLLKSRVAPSGPVARNGYSPLFGNLAGDRSVAAEEYRGGRHAYLVDLETPRPLDPLKMRCLRALIDLTRAAGGEIVAVRSPLYFATNHDRKNHVQEGVELRRLFDSLSVRFIDVSATREPAFRDPSLYRDEAHLNETGATLFSRMIADSVRAYLRPPPSAHTRPTPQDPGCVADDRSTFFPNWSH